MMIKTLCQSKPHTLYPMAFFRDLVLSFSHEAPRHKLPRYQKAVSFPAPVYSHRRTEEMPCFHSFSVENLLIDDNIMLDYTFIERE